MKMEYSNVGNYHRDKSVTLITGGDPFMRLRIFEAEMRMKNRSENDPERPPRKEPGDQYIILGLIAGLLIGGILGAVIGYHYLNLVSAIFCAIGGSFMGGIICTLIGDLIKKRRYNTRSMGGGSGNEYGI